MRGLVDAMSQLRPCSEDFLACEVEFERLSPLLMDGSSEARVPLAACVAALAGPTAYIQGVFQEALLIMYGGEGSFVFPIFSFMPLTANNSRRLEPFIHFGTIHLISTAGHMGIKIMTTPMTPPRPILDFTSFSRFWAEPPIT